jgi:hypothetical protein
MNWSSVEPSFNVFPPPDDSNVMAANVDDALRYPHEHNGGGR